MYFAYKTAMEKAGISTSTLSVVGQYAGGYIWTIPHGGAKAFASNTWVEGLHYRTPQEKNSAWYWYYPGSGIWIWSGKTEAFQDRYEHQKKHGFQVCGGDDADGAWFECGGDLFTNSKKKFGLDTVQYVAETDG